MNLLGDTQSAQKSLPSTFRISSVAPETVYKNRQNAIGQVKLKQLKNAMKL